MKQTPKASACDNPEQWGGEGGDRGIQEEETYVCLWAIHVYVWQKHHNIIK